MQHTTMRRFSDTVKTRGLGGVARRWLALGLLALAAVSAYLILTRDIEWGSRSREARRAGITAETNANYPEARRHYETALANNPYDWETHLALAKLLYHQLNDYDNALRHYLYALAYSPDVSFVAQVEQEIAVLRLIRSGQLENPLDALSDMFLAVEEGAEQIFRRRLALRLRADFPDYWRAWNRRGRGTVTYCNITATRDGFYDAVVELDFPDQTTMSMHFVAPLQDTWRLELSFP